jgi:hypothetical protein
VYLKKVVSKKVQSKEKKTTYQEPKTRLLTSFRPILAFIHIAARWRFGDLLERAFRWWLELEGGGTSGYELEPFNRDNKSTWSCDLFRVGSNDFKLQDLKKSRSHWSRGPGSPEQIT